MARKLLQTLAIWAAAELSLISCNGPEFSRASSDAASGGDKANTDGSGTAGKTPEGAASNQGGKASGGAASGGVPAGGGESFPGGAGEISAGQGNGVGGGSPDLGFQPPTEQLLYWFSADFGTTVEDGGVRAWQNRANGEMNAMQLHAGMRPQLMQEAPLAMPALSFDGVDDYMDLPELDATFEAGLSVFVVASASTTNSCAAFIELSNGIEIDDIHLGAHGNAAQYEIFQTVLQSAEGSFPVMNMHLIEAHHGIATGNGVETGPVELRINGGQAGSTVMPLPAAVTRGWNYLGRTVYETCVTFSGGLAEVLLYSRKVTFEERTAIELYLLEKWQL